ncbi:MAG: hypothetical protein K9J83_05490 [Desulfarculaceae bacterium]|nr:hypothetical protein [Desulfarculaceae bacterium]
MKKSGVTIGCLMGVLLVLSFIAAPASGEDRDGLEASVAAYEGILAYYSSMTGLENAGQGGRMDYADRDSFLRENRETIVNRIARRKAFRHLGDAHQLFENMYEAKLAYHPYTKERTRCVAKAYIDTRTEQRYVRKGPDSYAEYSKRGEYLRDVPADLPLLNRSLRVIPVDERSCYVLYEKYTDGERTYLPLPADEEHPKNGWEAEKVLTAVR